MQNKYIKTFETFISHSTVGNGIEIDYQTGPNLRTQLGVKAKNLKIGIYYDYGVQQSTIDVWEIFFTKYFNINPEVLDTKTINYERLSNLDLIVIPGGKAYKESLGLGEENKRDIVKYVENGGKLLAVCAGAHLVSEGHDWSLGIVPVLHVERQEDLLQEIQYLNFSTTDRGREIFRTNLDTVRLYYHGGPILYPVKGKEDKIEVLLNFYDEVQRVDKNAEDFTSGKIAALISKYGKGQILTISPHIEKSQPADDLLASGIDFLIEKRYFQTF